MFLPQIPIKRCYKFPRSEEDREEDWCTPLRRRHRVWGRAFELSSSPEALLESLDAPRIFFHFLRDSSYLDEDDDDRIREENNKRKIIWISDDTFVIAGKTWDFSSDFVRCLNRAGDNLLITSFRDNRLHFFAVQQPSIPVAADGAPHRSVNGGVDLVLRLMAKFEIEVHLTITARTQRNYGDSTFPASLDALKTFVGEARYNCGILFQAAGLSQVQWNTITAHCNNKVTIKIDYANKTYGSSSVPETAILNHCPVNLDLACFEKAPADKRQMILTALESTTCLERLHFHCEDLDKETFLLCMKTISRNRSITNLRLEFSHERGALYDLTVEEWEAIFFSAITSHPTLKEVYCSNYMLTPSAKKDEILIKMASQNKVLWKLEIIGRFIANKLEFDSAIKPVLECNRFRQVVQAIKQETSTNYYLQKLFAKTLFGNRVRRHPTYCYLLLKENLDLLKNLLLPMECDSASFGDLRDQRAQSLENTKQDCGGTIPTSLREDETNDMHGRKPKRSRSS